MRRSIFAAFAAFAALALACGAPAAARAQDSAAAPVPRADSTRATPLPVGAWVRVTQGLLRPHHLVGSLQLADSQVISLARRGSGDPVTLPQSAVESLELGGGYRTRGEGMAHGARRGLVVGVASTVVLFAAGAVIDSDSHSCDGCLITAKALAVLAGVPFTALTTGIGAIIGGSHRGERWTPVRTPVRTVSRAAPPAPAP